MSTSFPHSGRDDQVLSMGGERTRVGRSSRMLLAAALLLPVFVGLPVDRVAPSPFAKLAPIVNPVYLGLLTLAVIGLIRRRKSRLAIGPSPTGLLLVGLITWLAVDFAATGGLSAARNYVVVLVTYLALAAARMPTEVVAATARVATRVAASLSCLVLLVAPTWFVNKGPNFINSGKIIKSLPQVQGLLTHPNYTGFFFAVAILLEVASWRQGRRRWNLLFLALDCAMLLATQTRTSAIAVIIGLVVLVLVKRRRVLAIPVLVGAVAISLIPAALVTAQLLSGQPAGFGVLSLLGSRDTLWPAVAAVIGQQPLLGTGSHFLDLVHPLVGSADVLDVTHAHNQWLNWWGEGGAPALLLGLGLITQLGAMAFRRKAPGILPALLTLVALECLSETPLTEYVAKVGTGALIVLALLATDVWRREQEARSAYETRPPSRRGTPADALGQRRPGATAARDQVGMSP